MRRELFQEQNHLVCCFFTPTLWLHKELPGSSKSGPAGKSFGPACSKQLPLKEAAPEVPAWQLTDPTPNFSAPVCRLHSCPECAH